MKIDYSAPNELLTKFSSYTVHEIFDLG